jgi:hypothetical protein
VRKSSCGRPFNGIVRFHSEAMEAEKKIAEKMTAVSEEYVGTLMELLDEAIETCDAEAVSRLKRCIGLVIGPMEMNLFSPLYERFPEIEPEIHRRGRTVRAVALCARAGAEVWLCLAVQRNR